MTRVAYFDSSVLLAILRDEPTRGQAEQIWVAHSDRVSSRLLVAECSVTIRRTARSGLPGRSSEWLAEARARLWTFLDEIAIEEVSKGIVDRVEADDALGHARTLDAIHVATALALRPPPGTDAELVFCTLDCGQATMARALGFEVLPA